MSWYHCLPRNSPLLRYFVINAGTVLSKPKILDHVWRYDFGGDVNVVESYVSYLRRKIDNGEKRLLHTLRGWATSCGSRSSPAGGCPAGVAGRGDAGPRGRRPADVRVGGDHDAEPQPDESGRSVIGRGVNDMGPGTRQELRPDSGPNPTRPPSNFYVQGIDRAGNVWMAINDRKAQPDLPDSNDVGPQPVTIPSLEDQTVQWRAVSVHGSHGELITVAIDLSDVQSTVRALMWLQAGIGAAVLLILGVAGYWVVHRSLRPLVEVEKTAAAIAGGQLDSRVPQGIRAPRWVSSRWRSTGCWPRSSGLWRPRRLRRSRPGNPRTGCGASSPMPATNFAPR